MSRVRGRSFPITKNQAKGYGYAKARRMRSNPGVTTIAAINGRGAYAGRSARSVMSGVHPNARKKVAKRRLTAAQKAAFKARMAKAQGMKRNRSTSSSQSESSKRNIKKAQRARKAWGRKLPRGRRVRVGRASYGRKPKARRLKPGVYIANRRRKPRAGGHGRTKGTGTTYWDQVPGSKRTKKAGRKAMARRRKRASTPTKKRRSSKRRRKSTTKSVATPKRRRRRKARKGAARRKTTARKTVRRRRRRVAKKHTANRRRKHRRNAAPKRRRRRKAAATAPKRRRRRRKATTSRKRRSSSRRRVSRKRRRSGRRLKANGRKRRRSHRRNKGHKVNRRRRSSRRSSHKANRRRHRRNGRRGFRMNGVGDVLKFSGIVFGGFALHRVLSNVIANQVLARILPAPAAPAATSGFDLSGQKGLIASLLVGAGGSYLASKTIKNTETRKLVIGGMVASTIHGVVMSLLKAFMPAGADMLAGPEDGTAARLSAMYGMRGLGAGASIMPRYGVINGMGEYFREPMNGLGEYFREPMNGVGEYIAATNGLGAYEPNGDLYQAAAGFGSHDYNGNHIDPSGNLDQQLSIAEAAAGVGALSPFEAAAGIGPMQAAAGFGAIDPVPSGDTWVPGSVNPQLWAGVRSVNESQSATEMVPAGVLQTDGGQGIFG